ncbi:lipopolysaccharide biosynthesis protein [Altererythrobacter sp.]|uniref:lipopolysaccharide biosynthesis protein n=1 Tax=Altererythrobacter sp. TaxID=1872480 RepID=UPI001B0DF703|nr:lipopolysaccharide biosynthesis protein [Altererythrobacter sp.]MBO6609004.1 lipopolysaccharide biosynthesis protein [Altererythrobacter sp.]MBO6642543.1 lipopolysaccharide biosynthesis protein [Altererythrobacter sp.]MBO6708949.1 lipopolysaccharide biosynthesis protein [Altererythrobacter sp.]
MKRLWQNIGWLLGGRGFNAVMSLVYLALATRTLGLEGFGYFAIIIALGQAVTGLANFQTWQFVVRWGANGDGPADATGFAIALDMLSVLMGTIAAAVLVWTAQLWLPLPDELLWLTFGYCVVSLLSIRTTPTGLLRLRFKFAKATGAEAVQPAIRAAGAILAFFFMPTVTGFVLAWAAAEIAVALALWIIAASEEKIDLSRVSLRRIPAAHPDAWRFVWSTNMSGTLTIAGKQVMILMVGSLGGEALAGGFRVASQLGQALVVLAQTISKAIYPELVHAKDEALLMARRMANIALIGGVMAVLVALFAGRWGLTTVAGTEFAGFYWAMVILAIAGAVELVGASLESLLVSAGKAHTAFIVRAVPTVLALVLLDTAIDWNGAKGAAFAVLGSSSLAVIGFYVAILNLQQIRIRIETEEPVPQPDAAATAPVNQRD